MKKVLVITYYWPPSGGGGVQRWLKFTKYLPEFGWEPIILTPSNPSVKEQDESLISEINPKLKVYKEKIWEPYSIATKIFKFQTVPRQGIVDTKKSIFSSLLVWLRGNLLIPDTRIFWIKKAVASAKSIIENEGIDLVITTGPPHSIHLIGFNLKKKIHIKWIADFRDPWSEWDILDQLKLSRMARKKHNKLEEKVLKFSDNILTVSASWANDMSKKSSNPVTVITNGFDSSNFERKMNLNPRKFRVSHFGLINDYRNVPKLWQAIGELCENDNTFRDDLEIFLAGNIADSVFESFEENGLIEKLIFKNYIPHNDLNIEYEKTAVFLLFSNKTKNAKGHIPGKLFEYLYFNKPIMAFVEISGDVSKILRDSNSGISIDGEKTDQIRNTIMKLYKTFKRKEKDQYQKDISKYERRNLSKDLAEYLNDQLLE